MHPDQFVLLNTPNEEVLQRSIDELAYQVRILDLMGLDRTAKVQIHVGGVYGDKSASMDRFVDNYTGLDPSIKARLVIENDERLFSVADCCEIHRRTDIPVIFDVFHHSLLNRGEATELALKDSRDTWKKHDGFPMVDYSSQEAGKRPGAHAEHLDPEDFGRFLRASGSQDFDIMLEIKDKEASAKIALALAAGDPRLVTRVLRH
jgi:UV DNA damage endonuclease